MCGLRGIFYLEYTRDLHYVFLGQSVLRLVVQALKHAHVRVHESLVTDPGHNEWHAINENVPESIGVNGVGYTIYLNSTQTNVF